MPWHPSIRTLDILGVVVNTNIPTVPSGYSHDEVTSKFLSRGLDVTVGKKELSFRLIANRLTVDYNELVSQLFARVLDKVAKKEIRRTVPGFEPRLERN